MVKKLTLLLIIIFIVGCERDPHIKNEGVLVRELQNQTYYRDPHLIRIEEKIDLLINHYEKDQSVLNTRVWEVINKLDPPKEVDDRKGHY